MSRLKLEHLDKDNELLSSFHNENNKDYYNFSKELYENLNEIRLNPSKFIQYLNTYFSHRVIPQHPPITLNDLLGNNLVIDMNKFINLFNNINVINCSRLKYIKWNQDLYALCTDFLHQYCQINNPDSNLARSLNNLVSKSLNGNFRATHVISSGLFNLNESSTMIFLNEEFFKNFTTHDFFGGAISCVCQNNIFYFMIILAEKINEHSEISIEDPILDNVGYKDDILKAYILRKEKRKNFLLFLLKDGLMIEECINF